MKASRERAVAHTALVALGHLAGGSFASPTEVDLYEVALEFTQPRPWWRFW